MKRVVSVLLVLCLIVSVFAGCGETTNTDGNDNSAGIGSVFEDAYNSDNSDNIGNDNGNSSANLNAVGDYVLKGSDGKGNWLKVKKVDVPKYKSGEMTLKEFEDAYRPYTDWRIYQIRTTKSDVKPANGGKAYYVSYKGVKGNDGLSPEKPVPSYATIASKLKSGDVVYFERGGEYRGEVRVVKNNITLAAYGEGMAPVLKQYKESCVGKGKWIATDKPNVYRYYQEVYLDVGVVVFNEEFYTYKSFRTNDDVSGSNSKMYVNSYKDLKEELQMFHDPSSRKIYVYSEKGNPGEIYKAGEFIPKGSVVNTTAHYTTVDGLCIKFAGFGVESNPPSGEKVVKGLVVRNCEIGWIGGYSNSSKDERLGNAIQIWGGAKDFIVDNCYFYQVYDAGATFQYISDNVEVVSENIQFINSVYDYNNYSIEYFITAGGNSTTKDFIIEGNLFWYAGEGMCTQRPDRSGSNHIKSWGHENKLINQIKVSNNLFALGARQLCETRDITGIGAKYNKNVYVQTEGKRVAVNSATADYFKMDANVKANVEKELGDKNATIIKIKK